MAKFNIVEEYTEYVTKYYEVEAETEDEAIEMIQNGDIDSDDCDVAIGDSQFTVEQLLNKSCKQTIKRVSLSINNLKHKHHDKVKWI